MIEHWTPSQDDAIRQSYGRLPIVILAANVCRTPAAIVHRARTLGVRSPRAWTAAQDDALRKGWGNVKTSLLSQQIGRSMSAIKQRAAKLGLDSLRYYSAEDLSVLREMYPTHTAAEIAQKIYGTGRTAIAIYRMACRLGLRKLGRHDDDLVGRVIDLHREGKPCREIAAATGLNYHQAKNILRRHRLKLNPDRDAQRRSIDGQRRTFGIVSGGELRRLSYRRYAKENGWPEDFLPREVQILNYLAEHGPSTLREIADAIGMRTDRRNSVHGGPVLLAGCNRPGAKGTYTASLIKRGMIVYLRRSQSSQPKGKHRLPGFYMLSLEAIAHLEAKEQHAQQPQII